MQQNQPLNWLERGDGGRGVGGAVWDGGSHRGCHRQESYQAPVGPTVEHTLQKTKGVDLKLGLGLQEDVPTC